LVEELSDFYGRALPAIESARQDRSRVPELDKDLRLGEAALAALAREALALDGHDESRLNLVLALTDFSVWKSLRDHGVPLAEIPKILARLLLASGTTAA
jgi:hypothetical protein